MRLKLRVVALALTVGMASGGASAALHTILGTSFDLTYDDTQLGLFGTPNLVGDSLFFTLNNFKAESLNGTGVVTNNSTIAGMVLTAKNGYQFSALTLAEFGDYTLAGVGSLVTVQGQLRAFNVANPNYTQTTANLLVNPLTPLNINDGQNHDWSASSRIDANTAPVPSLFSEVTNVLRSKPNAVGLVIENRLSAYTDRDATGYRQAFIEKKLAGVRLDVTPVSAVPLPAPAALTGLGLSAFAWLLVRRRRA